MSQSKLYSQIYRKEWESVPEQMSNHIFCQAGQSIGVTLLCIQLNDTVIRYHAMTSQHHLATNQPASSNLT